MSFAHLVVSYVVIAAVSAITVFTATVTERRPNAPWSIALGIVWPLTVAVFVLDPIYYMICFLWKTMKRKSK